MKKIILSSVVLVIFVFAVSIFQLSCTKESKAEETTIIQTLSKEQILVAHAWKVDKLHHVIDGQYSEYTAGGVNTTKINYDKLRFTFNPDGTGILVNETGSTSNFTWRFTSTDKRSLILINAGRSDVWEMVEISDNYLHASVNLEIRGNVNNLETFRLIKVASELPTL